VSKEREWLQLALEKGWLTPAQVARLADEARHREAAAKTAPQRGSSTTAAPSRALPDDVREAALDPAKQFGKYILLKELGRGGFGAVFKAWQIDLGRYVALKFLHSESEEDLRRFLREAQTAAALSHPHIVPIHEVGETNGRSYIAMKYIDGTTLSQRRLPPREAAAVIRDAAGALEYAHSQGVIHRDLKPMNIMLDEAGRPWVMDFGLARQIKGGTTLTVSGMMVGTPAYMSPEQARGELHTLTPRTDVYALGATLYELLTHRPPFEGSHAVDIAMQVVTADPAVPRRLNPAVEAELETIVLKAMDKEPARRYASAREFADDLGRYLMGEPISAHPPTVWYRLRKAAKRHLAAAMTLATALAACLAAGAYFLGPSWVLVHGERRLAWPPGAHEFDVVREGFEPQRARVVTRPWGEIEWSVPLVPDHGFIELHTAPPGAEAVFLKEDREVARAKADGGPIRLPRGTLALRLTLPDYEPAELPVDVPPGRTAPYTFTLAHNVGYLNVTCEPDGVRMHIGDQIVALPVDLLPMPTGTYDVLFERENCFARRVRVTVVKAPRPAATPRAQTGLQWARPPGVTCLHAWIEPMEAWSARIGSSVSGGAAADIDLDGVADAVIADGLGNVHVFTGVSGDLRWRVTSGGVIEGVPAVDDLDRDGYPDVVVAAYDGRIIAFRGADGARLWTRTVAPAPGWPATGDVDGDGVPDVVVLAGRRANALSGRDGAVVWSVPLGAEAPGRAAMGDVDGDGAADVFVTTARAVMVLAGKTGNAIWTRPLDDGGAPVAVDLDRDGVPDCVVATASSMHGYAGRTGAPLWEASKGSFGVPVLADVNGDGVPDVAASDARQDVHVIDGRTGAVIWVQRSPCAVHLGSRLADLDADGKPDVIVAAEDGALTALSGADGSIVWRGRAAGEILGAPLVADVTGDGVDDVLTPSGDGVLTALSGAPRAGLRWVSRPRSLMDIPMARARLRTGRPPDILVPTNDGRLVALADDDGARLWEYATGDLFEHPPPVGDLDGDGRDEIAAIRDRKTLVVLDGTGIERWSRTLEEEGVAVVFADLEAAAGLDVVVVAGGLHAFAGRDGRPLWSAKVATGSNDAPLAADLDGDGTVDFILAGGDGNAVAISGRTGAVMWTAKVGRAAKAPALADVDGDGVADAVFVTDPPRVVALGGRKGNRLWSVKLSAVAAVPAGVGDVDGDGAADAIVICENGEAVALSGKSGRKLWTAPADSLPDVPALPVDLDGDGRREVVLTDADGRFVALDGATGERRWAVNPDGPARSWWAADVDGDGGQDVIIVSGAEDLLLLRGRDGALLEYYDRGQAGLIDKDVVVRSTAQGGLVQSERRRSARSGAGNLVLLEDWPSLLECVERELKGGAPRRDLLTYWRGLARLGGEEPERALEEFAEARRLGLRSPELVVSAIEACLMADEDPAAWLRDAGPDAALRILGEFSEEALELLRPSVKGDLPALKLLAGKPAEALAGLPKGDAWDWRVLALRAMARHGTGDVEGALRDLDQALVQNPWNTVLRGIRAAWRR